MRTIGLALFAIQVALVSQACAQGAPSNNCGRLKDPAEQLFCADPELGRAAEKLNSAIQERLNRLADRGIAIAENADWIRNRNSSCGIFGQSIPDSYIKSAKACLSKETEERIAMLDDPNFDCLATNTPAGMLICSDPALAIAGKELADRVVAMIAKLKDDESRLAFSEYARWTRTRDRTCDLVGKDNVPIEELSGAEGCLAQYITEKTAEIIAAKGDPKRAFGQNVALKSPGADAVDVCVEQIHSANSCENFLRVSRVVKTDGKIAEQDANVTAQIEMVVLSPFAACSPIASGCTGTCWDVRAGQARPTPASKESFAVGHRLKIEKSFAFRKAAGGNWQCSTGALAPVNLGIAASGP